MSPSDPPVAAPTPHRAITEIGDPHPAAVPDAGKPQEGAGTKEAWGLKWAEMVQRLAHDETVTDGEFRSVARWIAIDQTITAADITRSHELAREGVFETPSEQSSHFARAMRDGLNLAYERGLKLALAAHQERTEPTQPRVAAPTPETPSKEKSNDRPTR